MGVLRVLAVLEHLRVPLRSDELVRFSGGSLEQVEAVLQDLADPECAIGRAMRDLASWQSRRR